MAAGAEMLPGATSSKIADDTMPPTKELSPPIARRPPFPLTVKVSKVSTPCSKRNVFAFRASDEPTSNTTLLLMVGDELSTVKTLLMKILPPGTNGVAKPEPLPTVTESSSSPPAPTRHVPLTTRLPLRYGPTEPKKSNTVPGAGSGT